MEFAQDVRNNVCHDCGKQIAINNEEIENGVQLVYDNAGEKISADAWIGSATVLAFCFFAAINDWYANR